MLKEDYEKGKEIVEKTSLNVTLRVFKYGCDKKNYEILKSLPNTIKILEKKFELSKMPMNKRINELEKSGLIKRDKSKGNVEITQLGEQLLKIIEEIKKAVIKELPNLI